VGDGQRENRGEGWNREEDIDVHSEKGSLRNPAAKGYETGAWKLDSV